MRSLVTGGAGFIGSNLVDALLDGGDHVTVVDNLSSGREQNLRGAFERGAQLERLDVLDGAGLRAVFESVRPERVFHLAAQIDVRVSVRDPTGDLLTNVGGTINVLEAARRVDTGRVVFASTGGAIYGETDVLPTPEQTPALPMAPYGQSKFCAERYLGLYERLYGLSSIALRFSNVYGPRQDPDGEAGVIAIFCGCFRDGRAPTIYGDGLQTRDYLFVHDLTAALIRASELSVGGVLNVGTRQETTVLDLVRLLGEIRGDGAPEAVFAAARAGEIERSCLDSSRARTVLGWEASTHIEEGLRRTYEAALD